VRRNFLAVIVSTTSIFWGLQMLSRDLVSTSRLAARLGESPVHRETGRQRVQLQVAYLTSFSHSASNPVLHVFQCAEAHRVAIGIAARRVVLLADEKGYDIEFETVLRRCGTINNIVELNVLPRDAEGLVASSTGEHAPLNDADVWLQQSSQLDFIRTFAALYRPNMSGGNPPVFELDEGQPLASRVNCHRRSAPLRSAIIDGISRDALRALSDDHGRQIRAMQQTLAGSKQTFVAETVDFYAEREQLLGTIDHLRGELLHAQKLLREERDAVKVQLSQAHDDVRRARDEVTTMKLLRFQPTTAPVQLPVQAPAFPREDASSSALAQLQQDIEANEQFLSRVQLRADPGSASQHSGPRGAFVL
jgi:hypothetical protein